MKLLQKCQFYYNNTIEILFQRYNLESYCTVRKRQIFTQGSAKTRSQKSSIFNQVLKNVETGQRSLKGRRLYPGFNKKKCPCKYSVTNGTKNQVFYLQVTNTKLLYITDGCYTEFNIHYFKLYLFQVIISILVVLIVSGILLKKHVSCNLC